MRKNLLIQRTFLIEGKPQRQVPLPKDSGRRGIQLVEKDVEEYDAAYNDFFEFQKDLDDIEAANEQQRRAEIYGFEELQDSESNTSPEFKKEQAPSPIVMEEDEDLENFSPIIMEDFDEIPTITEFKRCLFTKENGKQCKRQAPKTHDFCSAHR